jgi:ribosomal RNA-processing protein 12
MLLQKGARSCSLTWNTVALPDAASLLATHITQQIRVVVERLVRRCGYEAVAAACPPGDAKLMSHIRKQTSRKERRKAMGSEGGSQVGSNTVVASNPSARIYATTGCTGMCVCCAGTSAR